MNIINNVCSILTTDTYSHYRDVPKATLFEKSITERIKLRKEMSNAIKRKEQNINNKLLQAYFNYHSPSHIYKKLSETENAEINKA